MADEVLAEDIEEGGEVEGAVTLKAKTDTLILKANPYRTGGLIVNQGAHPAWLSLGGAAAKENSGVWLAKEGGSFNLEGYDGEVRGIATEEVIVTVVQIEKPTNDEFSGTTEFVSREPTQAESKQPDSWEQPWGADVTLDKTGRAYTITPPPADGEFPSF
jgi:hypothetical protein